MSITIREDGKRIIAEWLAKNGYDIERYIDSIVVGDGKQVVGRLISTPNVDVGWEVGQHFLSKAKILCEELSQKENLDVVIIEKEPPKESPIIYCRRFHEDYHKVIQNREPNCLEFWRNTTRTWACSKCGRRWQQEFLGAFGGYSTIETEN